MTVHHAFKTTRKTLGKMELTVKETSLNRKKLKQKDQINFQAFGVHPEGSFECSPSQGKHR